MLYSTHMTEQSSENVLIQDKLPQKIVKNRIKTELSKAIECVKMLHKNSRQSPCRDA